MSRFRKMRTNIIVDTMEVYALEGSLREIIQTFKRWQELFDHHGTQWSNLHIEVSGVAYEGPDTIELRGDRYETDNEFKARMQRRNRRAKK